MKKQFLFLALIVSTGAFPLLAQDRADEATARNVVNLDKRVSTLEARMGRNGTTPTATNNLERRLDDIEDRLDDLEKKIDDLEKLERRVKDLERKK